MMMTREENRRKIFQRDGMETIPACLVSCLTFFSKGSQDDEMMFVRFYVFLWSLPLHRIINTYYMVIHCTLIGNVKY